MIAVTAPQWVIVQMMNYWVDKHLNLENMAVNCHVLCLSCITMWELYLHFGLLFLNVMLWGSRFTSLKPELKLLGVNLLLTLLLEGYAAYLMLQSIRNLYLYHFLTPVQYCLYAFIFYLTAYSTKKKYLILSSIPIYIVSSALITVYIQDLTQFNSYALSLKNVLIVCWVLLYYHDVFTRLKVERLELEPLFWVCTGLLFYSLGSFFVYGLMNQLLRQSHELTLPLYYITLFLGYLLYLMYLVAFFLKQKRTLTSFS